MIELHILDLVGEIFPLITRIKGRTNWRVQLLIESDLETLTGCNMTLPSRELLV